MKKLIILISFFITSCNIDYDIKFEICKEAKSYVDKFYNEGAKRNVFLLKDRLVVTVGKKETLGLTIHGNPTVVYIDPSVFEKDFLFIETVIFHELSHAVLKREHNEEYSLMNPNKYISDYRLDSAKRVQLINELFTQSSN